VTKDQDGKLKIIRLQCKAIGNRKQQSIRQKMKALRGV
jgi:hypothetical protein